ncbi:MAG TPA: hypothetical protein VN668_00735 [Stellaceae bacterium]|nr:hypothetical protein [Stellaceae bacterium]
MPQLRKAVAERVIERSNASLDHLIQPLDRLVGRAQFLLGFLGPRGPIASTALRLLMILFEQERHSLGRENLVCELSKD